MRQQVIVMASVAGSNMRTWKVAEFLQRMRTGKAFEFGQDAAFEGGLIYLTVLLQDFYHFLVFHADEERVLEGVFVDWLFRRRLLSLGFLAQADHLVRHAHHDHDHKARHELNQALLLVCLHVHESIIHSLF